MSKLYCFLGILLFQLSLTLARTHRIFGKISDAKEKYPLTGVTIAGV